MRSYLKNKRTGEIGLVVECLPNMHIPSTTEKDKERRRERRAAGRERKKDTYRSTQMGNCCAPGIRSSTVYNLTGQIMGTLEQ